MQATNEPAVDTDIDSPLTPVEDIPLIADDWSTSDESVVVKNTQKTPIATKRKTLLTKRSKSSNIDSDFGRDTESGFSFNDSQSQGSRETDWTSHIDFNSSKYSKSDFEYTSPSSDETPSKKKETKPVNARRKSVHSRKNDVSGSLPVTPSISNSISGMSHGSFVYKIDEDTYSEIGDTMEYPALDEIVQRVAPHPHYRLSQRRLNRLVLNPDHMSPLCRRKMKHM